MNTEEVSLTEIIKGFLDTIGLLPGAGEAADLISGLISLLQGRFAEAAISLGAAVPGIGSAGGFKKLGDHLAELGDLFGNSIRYSDQFDELYDAARLAENGKNLDNATSVAPKAVANFSDELTISGDLARARLRSALGLARGNADEAHHLIPVGLRDHDVVQRAARGGFNFNGVDNGVAMSFDRHRGVNIFHHNKYNDAIRSRLERELRNNPNMTDAQAADFLRSYTEQLRNAINNTRGRLR